MRKTIKVLIILCSLAYIPLFVSNIYDEGRLSILQLILMIISIIFVFLFIVQFIRRDLSKALNIASQEEEILKSVEERRNEAEIYLEAVKIVSMHKCGVTRSKLQRVINQLRDGKDGVIDPSVKILIGRKKKAMYIDKALIDQGLEIGSGDITYLLKMSFQYGFTHRDVKEFLLTKEDERQVNQSGFPTHIDQLNSRYL